ncbi:polysaccharide pyruvyl transferase family protein [Lentibacter algarum]|uniref:polysaccharide pyruvyl transferase family protein n=1 Tax=Lentibacter algarum TaxID=576131 RepID=UPI002304AA73|nr:polysaccharide pyruvyl transferase family protein [Lentibacter algarum]
MKKSIKLHYYRSKSGIPNFGDELSRDVVEFVTGQTVTRSGRYFADLIAIGSILDKYVSNKGKIVSHTRKVLGKPVFVWGSGLIERHKIQNTALHLLSVRGDLTKSCLANTETLALGDPGLFANQIVGTKKKQGIGIVPHYTDKCHPLIKDLERLPNVKIIDVERSGVDVCRDIAGCERILSSSLHGLIVADSFSIPNRRIGFYNNLKGGNFKFDDYASALDRQNISSTQLVHPDQVKALAFEDADFGYQEKVEELCLNLTKALKRYF